MSALVPDDARGRDDVVVADGAPLETNTSRVRTFTVRATDASGNVTTAIVTYAISLGACPAPSEGLTMALPGDGSAEETCSASQLRGTEKRRTR